MCFWASAAADIVVQESLQDMKKYLKAYSVFLRTMGSFDVRCLLTKLWDLTSCCYRQYSERFSETVIEFYLVSTMQIER